MIKKILPHITIVLSLMMLVLLVLNGVNEEMGLLRGDEFETLLTIYMVSSFVSSVVMITKMRNES